MHGQATGCHAKVAAACVGVGGFEHVCHSLNLWHTARRVGQPSTVLVLGRRIGVQLLGFLLRLAPFGYEARYSCAKGFGTRGAPRLGLHRSPPSDAPFQPGFVNIESLPQTRCGRAVLGPCHGLLIMRGSIHISYLLSRLDLGCGAARISSDLHVLGCVAAQPRTPC